VGYGVRLHFCRCGGHLRWGAGVELCWNLGNTFQGSSASARRVVQTNYCSSNFFPWSLSRDLRLVGGAVGGSIWLVSTC
jgi:hypothetical protein